MVELQGGVSIPSIMTGGEGIALVPSPVTMMIVSLEIVGATSEAPPQ